MQAQALSHRGWIATAEGWLAEMPSARPWFVTLILFLFTGVNVFLVFGHTFWRDEAHPLLIVLNNPAFSDFYRAMSYEGTPALWHFLLWSVARILPLTPFTAQVIHFIFTEAIAALVLFGFQIPLVYRIIILLQEPFVWNAFNVRQYQLAGGLTLLFAYCYQLQSRYKRLALTLTLSLLAQTCLHGTIVSFALFCFLLVSDCRTRGKVLHPIYLILAASWLLSFAQMQQPADLMNGLKSCNLTLDVGRLLYVLTIAPRTVLLTRPELILGFLTILLFVFAQAFKRDNFKSFSCLILIAGVLGIFSFIGYTKLSGPRHYWLLTYMIIALLVILHIETGTRSIRFGRFAFEGCLLVASLFSYCHIAFGEPLQLKSQSRNLASYLDSHFPSKMVLMKSEIFEAPARLYRNTHPPEFALGRQAYVSYTVWNHPSVDFVQNKNSEHIRLSELRSDLAKTDAAILDTEPVVVVSGFELLDDESKDGWKEIVVNEHYHLQLMEVFEKALNENYVVYMVRRTNHTVRLD